jgi:hypothetical protein
VSDRPTSRYALAALLLVQVALVAWSKMIATLP